jgi:sterol desaturase/sphingolipid hydroxylase (fatty acid hydroxylase superfamily)
VDVLNELIRLASLAGHEVLGAFIAFVTPRSRVFWVFLLTSFVPCAIFAWRLQRRSSFDVKAWWRWCFPKRIFVHPSARNDYVYYIVNGVLMGTTLGVLTVSSWEVYNATLDWLASHSLAPLAPMAKPHVFATLAVTALCALAMDFGLYVTHYVQHKVPLLWEFHKVHHSAPVMTPITVYRMHPVDDIVTGVFAGVLGGLAPALLETFVFPGVREARIMGLNPIFLLSYVSFYHLRHSHFWFPYPAWLSHILISPAQHQIHHSNDPRHFDRNMGFIFAFWDHLFGTLYVPATRERLTFGLSQAEDREYSSVARLYLLPFRKALRRFAVGERVEGTEAARDLAG